LFQKILSNTIHSRVTSFAVNPTYIFSRTIPLAWEEPPRGSALRAVPRLAFLNCLSAHR
jgi:hypothetical protein